MVIITIALANKPSPHSRVMVAHALVGPELLVDEAGVGEPLHGGLAGGRAQHLLREAHLPHADRAPNLRRQDPTHGTHGRPGYQVGLHAVVR